jgi:hypothetical protein
LCKRLLGLLGVVALWALTQAPPANADLLQLAQVSCSDGTQFNVELSTDSLNQLQDAINNIDLQDLSGWTCSLSVLGTILVADRQATQLVDSSSPNVSAGGGVAAFHFAFAAQPQGTGGSCVSVSQCAGYAVLDQYTETDPNTGAVTFSGMVKGHVSCVMLEGNATLFTFQVEAFSGSGTPSQSTINVQAADNGTPSSATSDMLGSAPGGNSCGGAATSPVTSGNVVVHTTS